MTTAMSSSQAQDEFGRLSPRNFDRLARFIESYSGIKMPASKLTMLEGRLRRRVRATGQGTLQAYCDHLFDRGGLEDETIHLIDAVTTNKTEFFREPEHFRLLTDLVVPALTARANRPLQIWSAASSTGAEAYTLAMVLADMAGRMPGLRFTITATDICTEVLETGLAGVYPESMAAPIPAELRRRYVARSRDRSRAVVRIVPELRALVQFGRVNLMEAPYPVARDMDVVFCRNILIYFDKPTQQKVLQGLCGHLRHGGYLFLGHSETIAGLDLPVEPAGPTLFRRI